jgi:hypothetical protein
LEFNRNTGILPVHHRRIVDFTPHRVHAHPRKGKGSKRAGKPRVIKRQKKEFPYMTATRAHLKAQLRAQYGDTA